MKAFRIALLVLIGGLLLGNAYHLYLMRYEPDEFAGMSKARLLEALKAEGVPVSAGYRPLNKDPFLENTLASRAFRRIYSEKEIRNWRERNECPRNDELCARAMWLGQTTLLGDGSDMERIAEAFEKIRRHADALTDG